MVVHRVSRPLAAPLRRQSINGGALQLLGNRSSQKLSQPNR